MLGFQVNDRCLASRCNPPATSTAKKNSPTNTVSIAKLSLPFDRPPSGLAFHLILSTNYLTKIHISVIVKNEPEYALRGGNKKVREGLEALAISQLGSQLAE
jgi:hypothetical protein